MKKNLLIFLLFFLSSLVILLLAPGLLDPDGFYHIKISQMMAESLSLIKNFPWLNFTILKDSFTDHHFLFHVLAIPFILISPIIGMKIFISILIGGFFTFFYFLLKRLDIKYPFFWTLLLLASGSFIFRLLLLKAISFSLIFLFLGFYFLKEKKYLRLFILSFFLVWSYGGFLIISAIAFFFFISEIFLINKKEWRFIFIPLSGTATGIVLNFYFPQNLEFLKTQAFQIPLLNGLLAKVSVGAEWYPYHFKEFLAGNFLLWLVFAGIIATLIFYRKEIKKRVSTEGLSAVFLSGFFFVLMVRSNRFVEYWVPFTILAGALITRDFRIDKKLFDFLKMSFISKGPSLASKGRTLANWRWLPISAALLPVSIFFINSIADNYLALKNTPPYDRYKSASEWLIQNTPEKSIVFNVSWDDFPELFFWDTHNYYIVGMDPTFMYEYDKTLYEKWCKVGEGEDPKPGETAKKYFQASAIFINKEKNPRLYEIAQKDQILKKSYEDNWVIIYKIEN